MHPHSRSVWQLIFKLREKLKGRFAKGQSVNLYGKRKQKTRLTALACAPHTNINTLVKKSVSTQPDIPDEITRVIALIHVLLMFVPASRLPILGKLWGMPQKGASFFIWSISLFLSAVSKI